MSQQDSGPDRPLQSLIDEAPITSIQIRAVLLCVLVFVTEGIDLNLVPLLAQAIAHSWSLPTSAFSAIFASGSVGLILGGVSVGWPHRAERSTAATSCALFLPKGEQPERRFCGSPSSACARS